MVLLHVQRHGRVRRLGLGWCRVVLRLVLLQGRLVLLLAVLLVVLREHVHRVAAL